jgi:hypothetical protein
MQLRLSATDEILWFVFSDDKHTGPFTSEEFAERANRAEFGEAPYIWTQGMEDWKPLSDFPELETFFLEVKSFAKYRIEEQSDEERLQRLVLSMADKNFLSTEETQTTIENQGTADLALGFSPSSSESEFAHSASYRHTGLFETESSTATETRTQQKAADFLRRYRLHLSVCVVILATAVSVGVRSLQENPLLPSRDLAKDEYQELRRTIGESLQYTGSTAAIGLSQTKIENPSFYISTNVEDGTKLEISIEGLPETLINRFRYAVQTVVTAQEHLAKTPPLTESKGKPIDPGAYRVRVRKVGEAKIMAQKVYFLGGTQDLAYETKLKSYQEALRNQATLEVMELRQLTETVARQLSDSNMKVTELFEDLSLNGPARRAKWATFENRWNQIDTQLNAITTQWTPSSLENEIYYGSLYAKLAQAIKRMQAVHQAQTQLFQPNVKRDDVRAVIASESLAAQNLIHDLRQQVGRLEKAETKVGTAAGLPPRIE